MNVSLEMYSTLFNGITAANSFLERAIRTKDFKLVEEAYNILSDSQIEAEESYINADRKLISEYVEEIMNETAEKERLMRDMDLICALLGIEEKRKFVQYPYYEMILEEIREIFKRYDSD